VAPTRDDDELFEDLDKFFAPIRDVDWDDDEAQATPAPQGEHVEIVGTTPGMPVSVPIEPDADEADDDEAWYGATPASAAGSAKDEGKDEILVDVPDDEPEVLPVGTEPADVEARWALDESDDLEDVPAYSIGEVMPIEDEASASPPTDEDLEAAAAHFAPSVRDESQYDTQPIQIADESYPFGPETPGEIEDDILGDLERADEARTVTVGSSGISGPSWQDVAAMEVGGDIHRGPGPGERDVPAAFMTGIVLAAAAFGALWLGPYAFAVFATGAILIAQGELFGVMVRHHLQPATAVGLVAGALMMAGAYLRGEAAPPAMFALGVLATFAWYMAVPSSHRKDVLKNIGLTVFNMAWIPLLAGYLIATMKLPDGRALVIAVVGLTFAYDTVAFLAGSVWGGSFVDRSLAPTISPKKSIEGLLFGTLTTVVLSMAFAPILVDGFRDQKLTPALLGLVVAAAATLGDLAESLVKRDLGIKDMGSILPGHGGVLDRIDSLLFVAPATFLLFRVVLPG